MARHGQRYLNSYHPRPGDPPSLLMGLAAELRLMIFEFALTEDEPIVVPALRELPAPPLYSVNQQIRDECMQRGMYYRNNAFHVIVQDEIVRGAASFCEDAAEHFAHILSITVEVRFSEHLMHVMRMASGVTLPRLFPKVRVDKPRIMRLKRGIRGLLCSTSSINVGFPGTGCS